MNGPTTASGRAPAVENGRGSDPEAAGAGNGVVGPRGETPGGRRPLEELLPLFRCPGCRRGGLEEASAEALRCRVCDQRYPVVEGVPFLFEADSLAGWLEEDRERSARDDGHAVGGEYHWREYRMDEFLPPASKGDRVLMLGAGDSGERPYLRDLGYRTVAFDIHRSPGTDFLADAHVLPLDDAGFDGVLSMQVLEHLHSPWTAVEEVARVLRPGGWFVGSVAFLKAYHESYFHMTHDGVTHLLRRAGLEPEMFRGAQSLTYTLYGALLPVGPVGLRRKLLGAVDSVLGGLRIGMWRLTRRADADEPTGRFGAAVPLSFREFDRLRFAPTVVFRARKTERTPRPAGRE